MKELKILIRNRGRINLSDAHQLAEELGQKESTCERKLRDLVSDGDITVIRNSKGWVQGYEFVGESNQNKLF